MNAPFHSSKSDSQKHIVAITDDIRLSDSLFWLQVIAEMKLKPGISLGPINLDRDSFDAWRT